MTDWKHPTGKTPKNVVLVCLGASRNTFIEYACKHDTPDCLLKADEVWTLNRGALAFRHDLAFVLDYLAGEAAHYPGYASLLYRHDRPIITSHVADWPAHVLEYPFKEIWNWLVATVKPNHQEWLINSVPLITLYATWLGVKELTIFGADYQDHSQQQEDGHACLSYWIGVMEAQGLRVNVPETTQLLGANRRFVYGYHPDCDPRPAAVARRQRFGEHLSCPQPASSATTMTNGV